MLAGTEDAQYPFWSPDSKNLGFFAEGKLKKVSASGGQPLTLCDAPDGKGGSWSPEGVILFAPEATRPIQRVSQLGGEPVDVTAFDTERGDDSHRHPRFLPDGKHFLYLARFPSGATEGQAVVATSLEGGDEKILVRSPAAAEYASGHLLFLRERTLMAQPFDPQAFELSGEPFPIADTVVLISTGTAQAVFSASQTGVLAFQGGILSSDLVLRWRGRDGSALETIGESALFTDDVRLSPTEDTAVVQIRADEGDNRDLWTVELERKLRTRFTFSPDGDDSRFSHQMVDTVLWEVTDDTERMSIHRKAIGGSGDGEVLAEYERETWPFAWHPDGDLVLLGARYRRLLTTSTFFRGHRVERPNHSRGLRPNSSSMARNFLLTAVGWSMARTSRESGRSMLRRSPGPGANGRCRWVVADGQSGGVMARRSSTRTLSAKSWESRWRIVAPDSRSGSRNRYFSSGRQALVGDSMSRQTVERFLVVEPSESAPPEPITVVVNWPAAIEAQR